MDTNLIDPQGIYITEDMDSIYFWKYQTVIYWAGGRITVIRNEIQGNN